MTYISNTALNDSASRLRRSLRGTCVIVGLSVLTLVAAGCGGGTTGGTTGAGSAGNEVTFGLIVPLSGANASVGEQSRNAAELAVADINKAGGIKSLGGAQVKLQVEDSTNEPQGARNASERMLSQGKISGAFGLDLSPLCTASLPVFIRKHVPLVGACISDTLVTADNGGYYFQIAPKGSAFGEQQVKFLTFLNTEYHMGLTKAAILYVDNPYGQSTEAGIEKLAAKAGLDIVLKAAYPETITDASPLATKIAASGAQVLFPVSYIVDGQQILSALKAANSHVVVVGGGAGFIWPPIGKALGDQVNGLISVASWNFDSKNVSTNNDLVDVTTRYKAQFGTFMPEQAGEAYAGIQALASAAEKAKSTDSQKIRDALSTIDITVGGATLMQPGQVRFDEHGANALAVPVMIQWQAGVPKTVFPPELATAQVQRP